MKEAILVATPDETKLLFNKFPPPPSPNKYVYDQNISKFRILLCGIHKLKTNCNSNFKSIDSIVIIIINKYEYSLNWTINIFTWKKKEKIRKKN